MVNEIKYIAIYYLAQCRAKKCIQVQQYNQMTFYYLCSGEYIEFETNHKRPNLQMLINNNIPSIDLMHFTITFEYISSFTSSTLSSLSFGTWKCKQLIDQNLTPVSSAVCLRVCVGMHHSSLFFNQLPSIPILNWVCFIGIHNSYSVLYLYA